MGIDTLGGVGSDLAPDVENANPFSESVAPVAPTEIPPVPEGVKFTEGMKRLPLDKLFGYETPKKKDYWVGSVSNQITAPDGLQARVLIKPYWVKSRLKDENTKPAYFAEIIYKNPGQDSYKTMEIPLPPSMKRDYMVIDNTALYQNLANIPAGRFQHNRDLKYLQNYSSHVLQRLREGAPPSYFRDRRAKTAFVRGGDSWMNHVTTPYTGGFRAGEVDDSFLVRPPEVTYQTRRPDAEYTRDILAALDASF